MDYYHWKDKKLWSYFSSCFSHQRVEHRIFCRRRRAWSAERLPEAKKLNQFKRRCLWFLNWPFFFICHKFNKGNKCSTHNDSLRLKEYYGPVAMKAFANLTVSQQLPILTSNDLVRNWKFSTAPIKALGHSDPLHTSFSSR